MKKSLSLILALTMFYCNAQKINFDKVYEDNTRIIVCNSEPCRNFSDRVVLSLSLGAISDMDNSPCSILTLSFSELATATEDFSIPDNATLLIRTADNSVIEATCEKGDNDIFGKIIGVGNSIANMKTVTTMAKISDDDLQHLFTGIIKIRCNLNSSQLSQGYYENNYKKSKLGDYFKKASQIIDKALGEKKSSNITDGF